MRATMVGLALCCLGCTQLQLARSTVNQGRTLSDLQRQQVLDNLAMFASNPDALAWHVKLQGGLVQVADQGSLGLLGTLFNDASMTPSASAQRGVVGQWDVEPSVDVDELESLQLAYRLAIHPQDAETRVEIYREIGETAVSLRIVLSESALDQLIGVLVPDPADQQRFRQENRRLRSELHHQISILEQLRAADVTRTAPAVDDRASPAAADGISSLKAMLEERVLTADTAQAWVMLTTEARLLTEDKLIKLTQEVCGAEMHFAPRYPADGRRERNVALVDQAEEKIDKLFQLLEDEQFQRPWLFAGGKKDVPPGACDVGRYGRCYLWTPPWARRTLTEFVLIVLAIAPTSEQDVSGGGGVAYSPTTASNP
jgi:hypothetical protein